MAEQTPPVPPGGTPPEPLASLAARPSDLPVADVTLFAQLFDVSPFPAVVSRLSDHSVIAINKRTAEIFGMSQHDAVGRSVAAYYVDPAERAELAERLRREGRADGLRVRIRRPDGTPFWALFSARLVTCDGELAILTVFTDISDQVAAETALRASEQRLAAQSHALTTLTARSADVNEPFEVRLRAILAVCAHTLQVDRLSMWRFDAGRQVLECAGLCELTANRYECGALLHRRDNPAYFDALEHERVIVAHDAAADDRTRDFRNGYLDRYGIGAMLDVPLRKENETFGVLCAEHVGGPRTWTIDEQNFVLSTANVISVAVADEDRRIALARLAESELRASAIVDTAHDAFVGMDDEGTIIGWNAQAERTFGWARGEVIGRSMAATIIPERFREAHTEGIRRFRETGATPVVNTRLELAALHRDGHEFPIEITISAPMRLGSGYFFGAFLRDISERIERDNQLRLAKETAEAATRAKSEFLANMSHELRTPLNGVLGYAQLLQRDSTLSPGQRESLEAIAKCGSHLLDLINDVLDLSKIEAGRIEIEPTATDLAQLLTDLHYVLGEAVRDKGLRLTAAIAPDVPRRVIVDGRHLRQVLLNLLGNAIRFTPAGAVDLRVGIARSGRLLFEVCDTGIGIEPDALEAIFEAFTQTRTGAQAGGSGLGLAISQHLIRRMGDQLRVDSQPGKGSRFYFELPLVPGPPVDSRESCEPAGPTLDARLAPGQHLTALVVDDSTVSRRILASLLESAGISVMTAGGGFEALELARRHGPDVVLMDLRMADLDGLEATRRLRADAVTSHIPVIAVTASAFGDSRRAAREAGCIDHLSKPIRAEALFASLQAHLDVRFVSSLQPPAGEPEPEVDLPDGRGRAIAARLADALALGDVTDLERFAGELETGPAGEAAIAERIRRLAAGFDFDGLRGLSERLAARGERTDA